MSLIRDNKPEPRGPRGVAGRMMVLPPDMERVLRYYLANAPEALPVPLTWPAPSTTGSSSAGSSRRAHHRTPRWPTCG